MDYLTKVEIDTQFGKKAIEVYCCDIEAFDQDIDILTISTFWRSYSPSPHTVFNALEKMGISVAKMSSSPEVDLRDFCNVWLTKAIDNPTTGIHRIGCVEMSRYTPDRSLWGMEKRRAAEYFEGVLSHAGCYRDAGDQNGDGRAATAGDRRSAY